MNLSSGLINKKTIFASIPLFGILILGLIASLLRTSSSGLEQRLKKIKADYQKTAQENNQLKNDYLKLEKDFKSLATDRENLLNRTRDLIAEKNLARELEEELKKLKNDLQLLQNEKEEITQENIALTRSLERLEQIQESTIGEKMQLEAELAIEKDVSVLEQLREQKNQLAEQNEDLILSVKNRDQAKADLEESIAALKKELQLSKQEKEELNLKLKKFNQNYIEAVEKNKALEKQLTHLPKKFTEIARQNRALIKDTANMHYNLGVFYTKEEEYKRAIAEYEKAIKLDPQDAHAYFNLGYVYAEYLIDRTKAVNYLKQYLHLANKGDKDKDWAKKYLLTWQSWEGKQPME